MFQRSIFSAGHDALRTDVAGFLSEKIVPQHGDWVTAKATPRSAWEQAGEAGILCRTVPEEYGGAGGNFLDAVVVIEELAKHRVSGLLTCLQSDIVAPFLLRLGNEAQKERFLPGMCRGTTLGSIALTEPQGGSALTAIETTASSSGGALTLNGTKTHITNGSIADFIIVAVRADKGAIGDQPGLTLLIVETKRPGVTRRAIPKSGMPALDTGEITFTDCVVPQSNILGTAGMGFVYLLTFLGIERLVLAVYAQACAERLLSDLIADCSGKPSPQGSVLDFQNTQFQLAELYADCAVNSAYIDSCVQAAKDGKIDPKSACIAKLRSTEVLKRIAALGVQFRGATGISDESGAQAMQDLADSAVQSVWGGASEILRGVIGSSLVNSL